MFGPISVMVQRNMCANSVRTNSRGRNKRSTTPDVDVSWLGFTIIIDIFQQKVDIGWILVDSYLPLGWIVATSSYLGGEHGMFRKLLGFTSKVNPPSPYNIIVQEFPTYFLATYFLQLSPKSLPKTQVVLKMWTMKIPWKKHPSSLHTLVQFLEFEGFNVQVPGSLQNERKHLREEIGLAILRDHNSNFEFQEKSCVLKAYTVEDQMTSLGSILWPMDISKQKEEHWRTPPLQWHVVIESIQGSG